MYQAKASDYDDNFGYFIQAMLLSAGACVALIVLYVVKRNLTCGQRAWVMFFLVFTSPVTLILFVYVYQFFFGAYFKL